MPFGYDTLPSLIRPLWAYTLQDASFAGVPFVLTDTEPTDGRRTVIHEYPDRAFPWVEDLGRANRIIPIRGYLVGDDVNTQRDKLRDACTKQGSFPLVHPSLGSLNAVCLNASFGESAEQGRVVSLNLTFILSNPPDFPLSGQSPTDAATDVPASAGTDFLSRTIRTLKSGIAVVAPIVSTVGLFAGAAGAIVGLATNPLSSTKGIGSVLPQGRSLGRYQGNQTTPNPALAALPASPSSGASLTAATSAALTYATQGRTLVSSASALLTTKAGLL